MSAPRRATTARRTNGASAADPSDAQFDSRAARRFNPSLKRVTEGGRVYGALVANQRERRGLSQSELAVRVRTSRATIERIEDGHPPDAELRQRLSDHLFPEPAWNSRRRHQIDDMVQGVQGVAPRKRVRAIRVPGNRRLWGAVGTAWNSRRRHQIDGMVQGVQGVAPRKRVRAIRVPGNRRLWGAVGTAWNSRRRHPIDGMVQGVQGVALRKRVSAIRVPGNRRLWGAVGTAALIALLVIAGARIFSGGDGAPSLQSSVAVSDAIGAPAAIHRARVEAQKAAVAEARREAAARRARERELAAAAATAARKRAAKHAATTNSSSTTSPPVAAPVTPSPSPSGGAGGGGSSAPAPQLGHGIGSG